MTGRTTRVAVLYNAPALPPDHPDSTSEADVVEVASAVVDSLAGRGFEAHPVPAAPPLGSVVEALADFDLIFNLIEGFAGSSIGEAYLTGLLELLGLAYTGCPPDSQALCHSKGRTKAMLKGFGLPTAPFAVVASGEPETGDRHRSGTPGASPLFLDRRLEWHGPWPAIVKPEAEDASLGIDQGSVVESPEGLAGAVARLRSSHGGDVLIEAYLPGREFNVGVLALDHEEGPAVLLPGGRGRYSVPGLLASGLTAGTGGGVPTPATREQRLRSVPISLPVAEIVYDMPDGSWPILTYDAKWAVGSDADLRSPAVCPADITPELASQLSALAVEAFRVTGCRDYARVDFRLDAKGDPMILEVNPNPDIGPGAGWARALRASGRDYAETLAALARQALGRGGRGQ